MFLFCGVNGAGRGYRPNWARSVLILGRDCPNLQPQLLWPRRHREESAMRLIGLLGAAISVAAMIGVAEARPQPRDPYTGDKRARCRAEASYIGGGGKGAAQRGMNTRELRREHVRRCMAG